MTTSDGRSVRIQEQQALVRATRKAQEIRHHQGLGLRDTATPLQVAADLGLDVRYAAIASMEGMYSRWPRPLILLSSLRPAGRQAFTLAHEVGHHVFQHGQHVTQLSDAADRLTYSPQERLADAFASALLMPKTTVNFAFSRRQARPQDSTPEQVYAVAKALGVGYVTLIQHMHRSLRLLDTEKAEQLRRHTPKQLRRALIGADAEGDVVPVDMHWGNSRAVDAEVGDRFVLPPGGGLDGTCAILEDRHSGQDIFRAVRSGVGRFVHEAEGWAVFVRIARRGFTGSARYRFLEDAEEDE